MSDILQQDLNEIVKADLPWQALNGETVLVTGGTGLLGSLLIRTLEKANHQYGLGLKILAPVRDERKARSMLPEQGITFFEADIRETLRADGPIGYILHGAAQTQSRQMAAHPTEVLLTNVQGTQNVLRLAHEKKAKSVVFLSSWEVYGDVGPASINVSEKELGLIDLANPRSCYPESKRLCECLCRCYFSEHALPVKVARLAQTFGPGVQPGDNRVFSQFADSAANKQDIVLHTEGRAMGNYCYTADLLRALFLLLFKGEEGETYNVSNPDAAMTIRRMAELVANEVAQGEIGVSIEIPEDAKTYGYASPSNAVLSASKLMALGWHPVYGLADMYRRLLLYREQTAAAPSVML